LRRRVAHRYLHPFPTRRSSDLPPLASAAARLRTTVERLQGVKTSAAPGRLEAKAQGASAPASGEAATSWPHNFDRLPTLAPQAIDRKSTRLNSSHVKISYAVFC